MSRGQIPQVFLAARGSMGQGAESGVFRASVVSKVGPRFVATVARRWTEYDARKKGAHVKRGQNYLRRNQRGHVQRKTLLNLFMVQGFFGRALWSVAG